MSPQDRIEQLAEHIVTGENPGDALDDLGEAVDDTLLAALVALTPADRARRRFVEAVDLAGAPAMAHIAWVRTPGDEIDAEIDRLLDGDEAATVCEALARAGVAWEHPALIDLLDDDRARRAAALTATVARPDLVAQWLAECQVAEDALEVLRAAALNGAELEESFSAWGDALASLEGADRLAARLDGLLAVLHPDAFARHALAGEADTAWLADRDVVADFLQVYGPTEWVEVLGLLEAADDEAFELAAYLATSAAAGIGYEEPSDDEIDRLGELLSLPHDADVERWQPIASSLGFGFAIAAAPDDQLGLLGAQVAAHERLSAFEIASAGIPGLPLSATHEEGLDLDATDALLDAAIDLDELHEASVVALVRTMSDLRALVGYDRDRFERPARAWVQAFSESDSDAVRLAARALVGALGDGADVELSPLEAALTSGGRPDPAEGVSQTLEECARGEGPLGLDCARRLAERGRRDDLCALARLWEGAEIFRVAFYRDCLFEALHRRSQRVE